LDVVARAGAVLFRQSAPIAVNVGVTFGVTVISSVVVVAHCPTTGVKVYVADAVLLMIAGLQVPVIPLTEVVGNVGAVEPEQKAGMAANAGVTWLVMVISMVAIVPHWLASGVNV
jgi:hypothetical protein